MPPYNSRSGVINLAVVVVIAACALLIVPAYKVVSSTFHLFGNDSKAKTEAVQLTTAVGQSQVADNKVITDKNSQITNLNNTAAQKKVQVDIAHQDIVATGDALNKERNPSINVVVAKAMNNRADKALDPLDQAKIDDMQNLVDQLTSQNVKDQQAAQAKLADMQSQLDQAKGNIQQLTTDKEGLIKQTNTDAVTASNLQNTVKDDSKKLDNWAKNNDSLLKRIATLTLWIGILIGAMALVYWVLPLIGKAFPAVAPLAKFMAALLGYPLHALHTAEKAALAKINALGKEALTKSETLLAAEKTAHAATQATLVTVAAAPAIVTTVAAAPLAPTPAIAASTPAVAPKSS